MHQHPKKQAKANIKLKTKPKPASLRLGIASITIALLRFQREKLPKKRDHYSTDHTINLGAAGAGCVFEAQREASGAWQHSTCRTDNHRSPLDDPVSAGEICTVWLMFCRLGSVPSARYSTYFPGWTCAHYYQSCTTVS